MANTITGKIYKICPTEAKNIKDKTYYERNIVVDNTRLDPYTGESQYPNFPMLSFSGEDKCNDLDNFKVGEVVVVSFEVSGVKYSDKTTGEEKIFNKVKAYKIEKYGKQQEVNTQSTTSGIGNFTSQQESESESESDLPF